MYTVVAELQGRDARAFFLARLEVKQKLVRVTCDGAKIIKFVIVAGRNDAAIANQHGRIVDNGLVQQFMLSPVF